MSYFPDYATLANLPFIEQLYQRYLQDPKSVDLSWKSFFEGIDFAGFLQKTEEKNGGKEALSVFLLILAYRQKGHVLASFNCLNENQEKISGFNLEEFGFSETDLEKYFPTFGLFPSPKASLKKIIDRLKTLYCGHIGFEYMHVSNPTLRDWVQKKVESPETFFLNQEEKIELLKGLVQAEVLETFIHTKYPGEKRFSLEGNETLIPMLLDMLEIGADLGIEEWILGMSHRGRLNVLANVLQKPYFVLFKEFEDNLVRLEGESGDVKYHKGYSSNRETKKKKNLRLHLAANSSCLESVDGIVLGLAKAKQTAQQNQTRVASVLIHGDAAIAGQGVFYETLQMYHVDGFSVGGTLQIVVNNQIGYTTSPKEGRSTRYCTDVAKGFDLPIFHVNAEDPEAVLRVVRMAVEIRQLFQCDVFIDLNGYRKYGHNETDEPAFTQPLEYQLIRAKKSIKELYAEKLIAEGVLEKSIVFNLEESFRSLLQDAVNQAKEDKHVEPVVRFGLDWSEFQQPSEKEYFRPVDTRVSTSSLQELASSWIQVPTLFTFHPKLEKMLQQRVMKINQSVDWGLAECLAFCSLLVDQFPIRLVGQDSCRGTFSHRHAIWVDQKTGERYAPYNHLKPEQARMDVYNTILSEFASLAFEFGYSWGTLKGLVIWEAQYGDFVIGAEIPIDHYIVSAEQKWARYSSLVLLLPHGYEGGGPEHSSARIERFLQLAVNLNIQVVNPSTPAQYFHVLRRQALQTIKKPLVIFTPKSLIRQPACVSSLLDFSEHLFQEVIDDPFPKDRVSRCVFCSGKIYYDLAARRNEFPTSCLIRIEQLYPFHEMAFEKVVSRYSNVKEWIWVQEEPENMGPWLFIRSYLERHKTGECVLRYVGRPPSASTATGSYRKHKEEEQAIWNGLKE